MTPPTQPGRELDQWLAVNLLGCRVRKQKRRQRYDLVIPGGLDSIDWSTESGAWSAVPHYSTTWEGAGLIEDAMSKRGLRLEIIGYLSGKFNARFKGEWAAGEDYFIGPDADYQHAPGAVALAAKAAIGGDDAKP